MRWAQGVLALTAVILSANPCWAADQIRIVSSSTVYPFAATVAEHFGKTSGFKAPVIESTGSGGGVKLFCAGIEEVTPDLVASSRRIKPGEIENCRLHGVTDIAEIQLGYDGVIVANGRGGPHYELTRAQLFLALAKSVPQNGKLVPNPYRMWSDIGPSLPNEKISIFGPAPNHGTRDTLVDSLMQEVCDSFPEIKSLPQPLKKNTCGAVREDGAFIPVTENYTVLLQRLVMEPHTVGILTYSYLDQQGDKIQAATLDGQLPTYDAIFTHQYPLSRPLYLYVKKSHLSVTAGMREFLAEFSSEKAWGREGYLAEKGLIALPDALRHSQADIAHTLPNMKL